MPQSQAKYIYQNRAGRTLREIFLQFLYLLGFHSILCQIVDESLFVWRFQRHLVYLDK